MKRHFVPGDVDRHGVAYPLPHCTGSCRGGRAPCNCATGQTELANAVPLRLELVRSQPSVPVTLTGGRIPRARRVRRFLRDLARFLSARRFRL